jgi:hypothetical protein
MNYSNIGPTAFGWKVIVVFFGFGVISACGFILYAAWYAIAHLSWAW